MKHKISKIMSTQTESVIEKFIFKPTKPQKERSFKYAYSHLMALFGTSVPQDSSLKITQNSTSYGKG